MHEQPPIGPRGATFFLRATLALGFRRTIGVRPVPERVPRDAGNSTPVAAECAMLATDGSGLRIRPRSGATRGSRRGVITAGVGRRRERLRIRPGRWRDGAIVTPLSRRAAIAAFSSLALGSWLIQSATAIRTIRRDGSVIILCPSAAGFSGRESAGRCRCTHRPSCSYVLCASLTSPHILSLGSISTSHTLLGCPAKLTSGFDGSPGNPSGA